MGPRVLRRLRLAGDPLACARGRWRVTVTDVLARWRGDAAVLRRRGAEDYAALLDGCAAELEAILSDGAWESVTLVEGSRASGYSVAHLRRLIAEGVLRNVSNNGRVRVRRGDLPRKPGHRAMASLNVTAGGPRD